MTHPSERRRYPLLALILSAVPGFGQIYSGYPVRGLIVFGAAVLQIGVFALAAASLDSKLLPTQALQDMRYWLLIVWLWNMADAYRLAARARTSIAIPIIVLILLNVAIGWQVTDMGTELSQVDTKSGWSSARRLTIALAKPDLALTYQLQTADATLNIPPNPKATRNRTRGARLFLSANGTQVQAKGEGFSPACLGKIIWSQSGERELVDFETDRSGRFTINFAEPTTRPGTYYVQAQVNRPLPLRQWKMSKTLFASLQGMLETIFLAFVGTAMSVLISLPLSFLAARNLAAHMPGGWAFYSFTRSVFNILRSIEVMIIAVIMTVIVGIGPIAGVIALSIHGIGALGKLYSEAIESIEEGPIEAVMATGANWLQVVRFGAVPQVVPQLISFTMYRWDINVRMATVIGLVGGGGIGYLLISYIQLLQWQKAATAIWLIAVVVMLMDYTSAVIRERVV
jgi:phosphonate transport system permease protein